MRCSTSKASDFVVLSDELGNRLAFEPLVGTATLRLGTKDKVEARATMVSRDGSVFALAGSEKTIVPAGEYRVSDVTITLDDAHGGERWSFVFSRGGIIAPPRWYKADKDTAVTIDPIGTPRLELALRDPVAVPKPGDDIAVRPALYTGDGLLIVTAYRGNPSAPALQEFLAAVVTLLDSSGKSLATAHSGFS